MPKVVESHPTSPSKTTAVLGPEVAAEGSSLGEEGMLEVELESEGRPGDGVEAKREVIF